jgi:hypothetical protein
VAVNHGRYDESIQMNRERIALARALHRRASEGWGHLIMGYAQFQRDSLAASRPHTRKHGARSVMRNVRASSLSASIGLANTLGRMGRYHDAHELPARMAYGARARRSQPGERRHQ